MRTIITTAIAAIMLTFASNTFANTNANIAANNKPATEAHRNDRAHHEAMRPVHPTHRCRCNACKELLRHHSDAHFAMHVKAAHRCECPTCNDIRHNERVMMHSYNAHPNGHGHGMAYKPTPAPKPTPYAGRR